MTKIVPYLAEEAIERDAEALLAEYARARRIAIVPPIPIDDIVEKHLKLSLEFDDTHKMFDVPRDPEREPDILGAMFFDEARIVIDDSLDPDENPSKEGRYRFTLAHEGGGHWRLHRAYFKTDPGQGTLFDGPAPPSVVCRSSQAKERVEWQADFYASCLLMPRNMVFAVWDEFFPDRKQRVLQPETPIAHSFVEIPKYSFQLSRQVLEYETDDEALEHFCKPLAERFLVSPIAMRIRLEKLGLLHRSVPLQRLLAGS